MSSLSHNAPSLPRALQDTRRMNLFVSISAAVAGLLFGLDIGVIAGALPFITDHFTLTCLTAGSRFAWGVNTA
ncbi:MAG: arabinose:proton symporter [Enterobacteriaceae bacterium]|nr:arabinose:proton symporter [Enterobacteriaceae bacterium]